MDSRDLNTSKIGDRTTSRFFNSLEQRSSSSPITALFLSLVSSAENKNADQIHIYLSGSKAECYFKISNQLLKAPKTFSPKVLQELTDYIESLANLELSPQKITQHASVQLSKDRKLNLNLIQNPESHESHLILNLSLMSKTQDLADLGFSNYNLENLKSALQKSRGIVVIDSTDPFASYNLISSILSLVKSPELKTSLQFDSSFKQDYNLSAHTRIFSKVEQESLPIIKQALLTEPDLIVFSDTINNLSLDLALEQVQKGKLVIINTAFGSASLALKGLINLALESSSSAKLLQELSLVISLKPIQTISEVSSLHNISGDLLIQLEKFFGITSPRDWQVFLNLANLHGQESSNLQFTASTNYSSPSNLIELLILDEDFKQTLISRSQISSEVIAWMAIQEGMLAFRHDGLIKSLKKELNIADVIRICS